MPRSRNSRSASPNKPVSAENLVEIERREILQNVHDIFQDAIDTEVIKLVLQECAWKKEEAIDKLLAIAESREEHNRYKSKLHRIAEGVFGSLRSEDYGSSTVAPTSSSLSQSQKVIRPPSKNAKSTADKTVTNTSRPENVGSSEQLLSRGFTPSFYLSGAQGNGNSNVDEIEMDLHFPQLPTKTSDTNVSSPSSSISSQKSHSEPAKAPTSSKSVLLSQAQSAFNQQFDDAEGTQRWEQYKQKLSEHYLSNLTRGKAVVQSKSPSAASHKQADAIPDDPAILQAELESPRSDSVTPQDIEKPRSESSRSFPVRLLSRSPDSVDDSINSMGREVLTKSEKDSCNLDSADLDETVLKCIYEVQGDLLDDKRIERGTLSQNTQRKTSNTPTDMGHSRPAQQSNEAMTLPTIGLSVDAEEFVPRAKPAVSTVTVTTVATEQIDSSPQPASKMTKSGSIEIKPGVKNAHMNSSSHSVGSPLTVSPSLSPGLSPPSTMMGSPVANLTGSPMFITPKWPPVLHTINHPPPMTPPVLASTTSRYQTQAHHLSPQGYRFPPGVALPYSSRMVYTVAPPPMFRMAGMQQYVQQTNLQLGEHIEDRAAIATGQPIMATSESSRLMSLSGLTTVKLINQSYIEEKVEKIQMLQKAGLKVLVIVRGLPGSGKSTLARAIQLNGIVLSTDDYFMKGNVYEYNPDKLTEAHQWNRERAKEAMRAGKSPVVIDNTNTQQWEFKPYANLALTFNYHIEMMEPNTPWKYKASELARRTLHGVPAEQIERMSFRYEHNITVEMLIRKRRADNRANENDVPVAVNELKTALVKQQKETTAGPEEVTALKNQIIESQNVKDFRLQNTSKTDDNRKQKSVESDSDSICSFQSGSLSNQSSRNASPKPLRPSLKTPGALQKMEKLKPPVINKPFAVKPTVKKVKRKAIKQMELKLSADTVEIVNDMVSEHVGERILSMDDVNQLEAELKALLIIYPVNETEILAAEELISLKLQDFINQSAEIPEDEINVEEESCVLDAQKDINITKNEVEVPLNDLHEKVVKSEGNSETGNIESVDTEHPGTDDGLLIENQNGFEVKPVENEPEFDMIPNEIKLEDHNMQLSISDSSNTGNKRAYPTWTDIAAVKNGQTENLDSNDSNTDNVNTTTCLDSIGFERQECFGIMDDKFELEYWGKETKNNSDITTMNETEASWSDCLEGYVSQSNLVEHTEAEQIAKPQRTKKQRSSDSMSNTDCLQLNSSLEINENADTVEVKLGTHISNELPADENEIVQNTNSSMTDNDELLTGNNVTASSLIERINDRPKDNTIAENSEVSSIDEETCVIADSNCSNTDIQRSQNSDHETLHQNSSLQMLKVSYTDAESAVHHIIDNKGDLSEDKSLNDNNKIEMHETDTCNDTESTSFEKTEHACNTGNNFDQKSIENFKNEENKDISENVSCENVTGSNIQSNFSREVQSSESFDPKVEDSETDTSIKSVPDHEVTQQASQQTAVSQSSGQGNKKSRRKIAANLQGPFLNHEDKEKFKTSAWSLFPLHGSGKQVITPCKSDSDLSNGKDMNHAMTMTEVEFFNLTAQLNQGGFVDTSIQYLIGNPKKLVNGHEAKEDQKTSSSTGCLTDILTIDKSTSTEDFIPLTDTESVEFLHTCFPTLPIAELECVLENCDNNTEWAINLLLDWKYSLNLSEEEKKKFAEGVAGLKRASPTLFGACSGQNEKQPSSLLDICFSLVEKEKIASRQEIEKQLIQSGKERLDRIEDDNITKIRLHRSTSLSETSYSTEIVSPSAQNLSVFRSVSSPAQIPIDNDETHFENFKDHSKIQAKLDQDINRKDVAYDVDVNESRNDFGTEMIDGANDIASISVNHVDVEHEEWDIKPALTMNVDTEVIGELEDMFGPLGNRSDMKEGLSVPLDRKTSWLLYQCVKKGIILRREHQQREKQQLVEDEELARQLQDEENAYMKPGTRNTRYQREDTGSRTRRATPLVGLSVQGTIPQARKQVAWNRENKSLAEIMQEEQRIQDKQDEFKRLLESEGGHTAMATSLKRQKLYGRFPKLDRKLLNEIFEANCYNLSETTAAIATSIHEGSAGQTAVTDSLQDSQYEDNIFEATKQQSMQEMLDSYIYHSVVSKDYQDGMEPEYEDYRGEANLHFRLRHECFQKAREAYRRGLKEVASFYSQQGHQHTQKIKEANMRASDQILADRNTDLENNRVDLHGLHVDEAIAALNKIIPQKEKERCKKLAVITGRGSHSRGGVARLRPSVVSYLRANQYNYTEVQSGVFNVSLKYRTPDR